ncbi:hypothetical protein CT541_023475 [Salmonella enterica subsp. enterica serovar Heidelberg]|nr:hypothetical protein CT541_023475 [Salmonella enterica subsp. enterica serovar Heidelberg]
MATHFARGILTEGQLVSIRLSSSCHIEARNLPAHRRTTAAWRLQIVVWQNMSFQSNHPE